MVLPYVILTKLLPSWQVTPLPLSIKTFNVIGYLITLQNTYIPKNLPVRLSILQTHDRIRVSGLQRFTGHALPIPKVCFVTILDMVTVRVVALWRHPLYAHAITIGGKIGLRISWDAWE